MDELDVRKKLQDKANEIVDEAIIKSNSKLPLEIHSFLRELTGLALKQGYIWGVDTMKQTAEICLDNVKGTLLTQEDSKK